MDSVYISLMDFFTNLLTSVGSSLSFLWVLFGLIAAVAVVSSVISYIWKGRF